jgi:hypothetical protein
MFILYKDAAGYYRWTLYAANNRKIACSGEGFSSKQGAIDSINLVRAIAPDAKLTDRTVTSLHDLLRR